MKAIVRTQYGPPEVLQLREVEQPEPKDREVLVKVHAATVNRTDCGILWGKPFIIRFFTGLWKPSTPTPGTDFAGEVTAVGKEVTAFKPGDRVWGFNDTGLRSHAQYLTIAEDNALARIPDGISYEEAAASGEGAHYAYNFVNKLELQPGQRVLVNGATGAIGSAAVQLLKHYGIGVTAVCSGEHTELLRSLGAERVIDYTREDFTQDGQQYHAVFDAVGKSSFGKCKRLLYPGGIYLSSELGFMAQNPILALLSPLLGSKKVKFPLPVDCRRSVLLINGLLEKGEFRAVIDRKYPIEQIAEAYYYVASGKKIGNVVITVGHLG